MGFLGNGLDVYANVPYSLVLGFSQVPFFQ